MRNQYTNLMGKVWNLALQQKGEIVKKSNSREECLAHMGTLVNNVGRTWCRQQRFIFPGQELDELKGELAPIYIEAFDKTRVVETQIMDQVKVHLDRRMKEVEEAFSERMDIARMEFEERARQHRDTLDRVRGLVLKNKEFLSACKTEEDARRAMEKAVDRYAREYVKKKAYIFPSEVIEGLKKRLWPECRDLWNDYKKQKKNEQLKLYKKEMIKQNIMDQVRKKTLINLKQLAAKSDVEAEFEKKVNDIIDTEAEKLSQENKVEKSCEKIAALKSEMKAEMQKAFKASLEMKLTEKLANCEFAVEKKMKKIVSQCRTVPECLKRMEAEVDTYLNGGRPLGMLERMFRGAEDPQIAALKRKLTPAFTDALLMQQYSGKQKKLEVAKSKIAEANAKKEKKSAKKKPQPRAKNSKKTRNILGNNGKGSALISSKQKDSEQTVVKKSFLGLF